MSNPADEVDEVDESAFGAGGEASADADYEAAFDDGATSAVGGHTADEATPLSADADIAAAFDDPSRAPVSDGDAERAALGY